MGRQSLIQFRRGTWNDWKNVNPILESGEPGFETDTGILKIGDGSSTWNALTGTGISRSQYTNEIIGIEWNSLSNNPVLQRIDVHGNPITTLPYNFFDAHTVWGGRRRCVRDCDTGEITFGSNPRGDGLVFDGSEGDVLVQKPKFYHRYEFEYPYHRRWISANPTPGFTIWPAFVQRSAPGAPTVADYFYDGAYEAYGYLDVDVFKLGSASGKQPITGGVGYPNLPNSGRFTMADAEAYANNIGGGFGITNFWNYCGDQLLMYVEYGTFDIQSALGSGIVDLPGGTGFAGKMTGADSIDLRLAENGTGVGSGVNGQTPVCWRGKENPTIGNCWEFIIGANFYKTGSKYRLVNRDGTGTLSAILTEGSYEEGAGIPLTEGYISGLLDDELGGVALMPSDATGSSSTYLCDYWWPPTGDGNILRAGGDWCNARRSGPGCRNAIDAATWSSRSVCARLEFRPLMEA